MTRREGTLAARSPFGSPRRWRATVGALIALTTFLTLTSTASFAAFSASNSFAATATSASTSFATNGLSALSTTFTASATSKIVPMTISNTGSAPLVLSSVTVSNGGSAALGAATSLRLWLATTCATTVPSGIFSTTLAAATSAISSSFALTVPAGATVQACAATTLTGSVGSLGGLVSSPTVTLTATTPGSATWTATDGAAAAALTFTQSVAGGAPTALTCAPGDGYRIFILTYSSVDIGWTAPAGVAVSSYRVYVGGVLAATTTNTVVELDGSLVPLTGQQIVTVSAVVGGVEYLAATHVTIDSQQSILSRNITCA